MAKVAGTAFFEVDATRYDLKGSATVALADIERETVMGLDGYHGYKEMKIAPFIEVTLTDRPTFDINVLNSLTDVTVTIQLDGGKTGVLRNAVQMNQIELNVDEGELVVRFEGPKGEWI